MGFFKPNVEKMKAKGDVEGLIKALKDDDKRVREAAEWALGRIGGPERLSSKKVTAKAASKKTKKQKKPPEEAVILSSSTFSWDEIERSDKEMGEMYFQCPKCGTYERVNNIGKVMLASDPSHLTSVECVKCKHTYNARSRLKKGRCPGFDYDSD